MKRRNMHTHHINTRCTYFSGHTVSISGLPRLPAAIISGHHLLFRSSLLVDGSHAVPKSSSFSSIALTTVGQLGLQAYNKGEEAVQTIVLTEWG